MTRNSRMAALVIRAAVVSLLLLAVPAASAQTPAGPEPAQRAVVRYAGGAFELVSLTAVETVLPPSDDLPGQLGAVSGFWFELQGADNTTLYRRIIDDPVLLVFEGPDQEAAPPETLAAASAGRRAREESVRNLAPRKTGLESSTRSSLQRERFGYEPFAAQQSRGTRGESPIATPVRDEAVPAERTFAVLIPAGATGDQLVLFGTPPTAGSQAEAATELARFALQQGPAKRGGAQ